MGRTMFGLKFGLFESTRGAREGPRRGPGGALLSSGGKNSQNVKKCPGGALGGSIGPKIAKMSKKMPI